MFIVIPVFPQFLSAITEFNSSGYVSDASRGSVIYGQILIGIAILIIGVKFYLYEIILIKYGEMGSINRLAISALLVNAFVGCINPSQMIDAILDYKIFTFSVITQLIFNVINIIVMMHLSAVEFSINLISSAIWAIFISSVGNYHHASQNYYSESYSSIILNTISLIVLLLCLIYFAIHNSQWYSQANEKLKKEVKIVTGVKAFWKSRFLQRKQFTRAASQQQNSVLDPTENMKALKIYDQLKRSQTNVTMELKNTQSDSSLISPAPIPKSHSIFPNDKGGSSLKRVVTCNKNTNVLCYVQPIRTDTVQQLIIANNEAQNSMQEDSAMLTFDQIGQKLKDMLGVEKDELVW
ncbi:Transmembrane domain-containing protein [Spironucleus salmonicida]|uniref:Transmembrane domain-containing protein n=2 Tax=Spironucleus salmonicida TaxID=348837 RepID=V6LRE5_9EUKA|nr:Transmembrane domain-containing protein [Spironucleus salmonicida]|eukprot:EST46828.1 Transmembrane domain-containing protein [Spironucleus salmonicida]